MRKKKQKTLLVLLLAVVLMLQYTVSIGFMSAYAGEEDNKVKATQDKPSASENKEEAKPAPKEESTQATYEEKQPISANVTFSVVNGSWNDGGKEDKTVTLTGYEGAEA